MFGIGLHCYARKKVGYVADALQGGLKRISCSKSLQDQEEKLQLGAAAAEFSGFKHLWKKALTIEKAQGSEADVRYILIY